MTCPEKAIRNELAFARQKAGKATGKAAATPAARRVAEESDIELLISTDSVENPHVAASSKIRIVSVAPLFAEAVARISRKDSISELFDNVPANVVHAAFK